MADGHGFQGWYCEQGGQVVGPLTRAQIRQRLAWGEMQPQEPVWDARLDGRTLLRPVPAWQLLAEDRLGVLVVDGDPETAQGIGTTLQLEGAEVCVASTGAGAVAVVRAFEPNVVLLDLGLPPRDGYRIAFALRRQGGNPVLVGLTAHGSAEQRRAAGEVGLEHYLVKPVPPAALKTLVEQLMDERARAPAR
jgi:CheY-like chemotaxis protein